MPPALAEIEATIGRLKARLLAADDAEIRRLLVAYDAVDRRFSADLDDPRDLALSRGAALMLIRQVLEDGP